MQTKIESAATEIFDSLNPYVKAGIVATSQLRSIIWWDDNTTTDVLLKQNILFIKAIVRQFPEYVPSTYTIASILLTIDMMMGCMLYRGDNKHKMSLGLAEASRGKQLVQRMRSATRRSSNSREPELAEVKGMMMFHLRGRQSSEGLPTAMPLANEIVDPIPAEVGDVPLPLTDASSSAPSAGVLMDDEFDCSMRDLFGDDGKGDEEEDGCDTAPLTAKPSEVIVATATGEPAEKKARIVHLDKPGFVDEVAGGLALAAPEVPLATPKAQQPVKAAPEPKWDVEAAEIPDPERTMPSNFPPDVHAAFMRLPERALPQGMCKGKYNFTIKDKTGAAFEIQLSNKLFRVQRMTGGQSWSCPTNGSPNVKWSLYENLDACFDKCIELAGGWTP